MPTCQVAQAWRKYLEMKADIHIHLMKTNPTISFYSKNSIWLHCFHRFTGELSVVMTESMTCHAMILMRLFEWQARRQKERRELLISFATISSTEYRQR